MAERKSDPPPPTPIRKSKPQTPHIRENQEVSFPKGTQKVNVLPEASFPRSPPGGKFQHAGKTQPNSCDKASFSQKHLQCATGFIPDHGDCKEAIAESLHARRTDDQNKQNFEPKETTSKSHPLNTPITKECIVENLKASFLNGNYYVS